MEVEVRALIDDGRSLKKKLLDLEFTKEFCVDQVDTILDKPNGALFRSGQKIRIRVEDGYAELTYKGFSQGDESASRRVEKNIEISKGDVPKFVEFFEYIGYPVCLRIPKKRVAYKKEDIVVTFDYYPIIGCVVEIEGDEDTVKDLAQQISPSVSFKNYRFKELFATVTKKENKSIEQLQQEYEDKYNVKLGNLKLLLS